LLFFGPMGVIGNREFEAHFVTLLRCG
jgi:hypothetical protein